jgi:DNA-binding NtrC family response regulator
VNVRVVAAANEPLEKRIQEGTFREDLYYRLNVIPIQLPPLRERRDDIPLLVAHFLKQKTKASTGDPFKISRAALDTLVAHEWPGNVRELENALERATALCESTVLRLVDLPPSLLARMGVSPDGDLAPETASLPPVGDGPNPASEAGAGQNAAAPASARPLDSIRPLKNYLREQEQSYLNRVMETTGGDKEQAAIVLGVSLATLYRKLSGDDREA